MVCTRFKEAEFLVHLLNMFVSVISAVCKTLRHGTVSKMSSLGFFVCAEAVGNIISFLGMQPCERSDKVPENKNSHVLFLAGGCWTLGHWSLVFVVCIWKGHKLMF